VSDEKMCTTPNDLEDVMGYCELDDAEAKEATRTYCRDLLKRGSYTWGNMETIVNSFYDGWTARKEK
jgi:hypothetical protein